MQVSEAVAETFMPVNRKTKQTLNLAMQELFLTGTLYPAGARLFVHHTFVSAEKEPLEVIYTFMLPRETPHCAVFKLPARILKCIPNCYLLRKLKKCTRVVLKKGIYPS